MISQLKILLQKDLRYWLRNPFPWLFQLMIPLLTTAIIGIAFGRQGAPEQIRFAIVDEDKTILHPFLSGWIEQSKEIKAFSPVFLTRDDAMRKINENKISAIVIIPKDYVRKYLTGQEHVTLELIKNPAQSINPCIIEEFLNIVATVMDVVAKNCASDFPKWQSLLLQWSREKSDPSLIQQAIYESITEKPYLYPPLVSYEKGSSPIGSIANKAGENDSNNICASVLIGLSSMFLMTIAGGTMGTLFHNELRGRTLDRYQTMRQSLHSFIISKAVFTVVLLLASNAIMLAGGGLAFGIHWRHPMEMIVLTVSYSVYVVALFAIMVAVSTHSEYSSNSNTAVALAMSLVGGAIFSTKLLPQFVQTHISPLLPTYGYIQGMRTLENCAAATGMWGDTMKWGITSIFLIGAASLVFQRRFNMGNIK